ncbi:MAG: hypothetical protein IJ587_05165 [Synergistaceae bacterium]|nr:hypothetical protein [Synergistaceae bacterium]
MKSIRDFNAMTLSEQESFLSHSSAELVQRLYYENNRKGLEVVVKNLTTIMERAKDCLDCLDMLGREGDVYTKLYLLLEYMGKDGISEDFVAGLAELTERAQETLARNAGVLPMAEEEREVLKRLNSVMTKNEILANRDMKRVSEVREKAVTQPNPVPKNAPSVSAEATEAQAK